MVNVIVEHPYGYNGIYEGRKIHTDLQKKRKQNIFNLEYEDKIVENCYSEEIDVIGINSEVVAEVPVVLAALTIKTNVHSKVDILKPLYGVKKINKNIIIKKCDLLQEANVIFIEGLIRKKIDCYTISNEINGKISGEVETLNVDIPFKCTTLVNYNFNQPEQLLKSTVKEYKCLKENYSERNKKIICDDCDSIHQIVDEYYNETPYCEVISSRIIENENIIVNDKGAKEKNEKYRGNIISIEGDAVLSISIRILEKKLVNIPENLKIQ